MEYFGFYVIALVFWFLPHFCVNSISLSKDDCSLQSSLLYPYKVKMLHFFSRSSCHTRFQHAFHNNLFLKYIVKPVYNDHTLNPKLVAFIDRWSLYGGLLCTKSAKWDSSTLIVIDRWSGLTLIMFVLTANNLNLHAETAYRNGHRAPKMF